MKKAPHDENCVLEVHDVTMKFNKYAVGVDSLKELIVRAFKGDLKREKHVCLKHISFQINRGEAVAVIGRNGVGKSTLLKIVSGILKPTSGWARVYGRISPLLKLGAGFDGNATGMENIYLNAAIMGYTKRQIENKMDDILKFAELGEFINSPVKNYSSGMLSRLGFSIAINMDSDILLVDEILGVGDAAFQKKCYARLMEKKEQGTTFIIVSHTRSVVDLCERAVWLKDGKIEQDGTAKQVIADYTAYLDAGGK